MATPRGTEGSYIDTALAKRAFRDASPRVTNFPIAPVVVYETDLINTMPARLARQLCKYYPLRLVEPPLQLPGFDCAMFWHPRLDHNAVQPWLRDVVARVCRAS